MDKRWSDRGTVEWCARLRCPGLPELRVCIWNVGLEGLFIEAANLPVSPGGELEVCFLLPLGGQEREYCVPCRVVHQQAYGLGVHFRDFHRGLFRDLQTILYTLPRVPRCPERGGPGAPGSLQGTG